jgi:hypothetical protein
MKAFFALLCAAALQAAPVQIEWNKVVRVSQTTLV